ncbi:uncharacterized protein LOC128555976 [Mercenaria mercenaria]|uniref:uncharacterized protein LOC128555976 n=1 Tax=Mercenaria mercenaria TaxID=6596 RepID=UPI00234F2E50|nr:uncharacterized protein LOC128555976 [Mercenaria mercenaria]
MDETGLSLAPKPPKIIARKGSKIVHAKSSNSREMITIIACGNAAGSIIPPHVIVPGKTKRALHSYDTGNAPAGTQCSVSDSGWTKQGISELWFTETFLPNIGPHRPQVLIVDGHDSHHHVELIGVARKEGIVIVELPSKTSHFTQPFDRSVFKSFKTSWGRHVQDFTSQTGVAVGHSQFFRIMTKAWNDALTSNNVKAGFEATGICPFNPGVIPDIAYSPSELYVATPLDQCKEECNKVEQVHSNPSVETAVLPTVCAASSSTCTGNDVIVSIDIDVHEMDQVVDLPVCLDENGMIKVLEEQLGPQQGPDQSPQPSASKPECNSSTLPDQTSNLRECDAAFALSVVESAITDEKINLYNNTYQSGSTLNDSIKTGRKSKKGKENL